MKTYRIIKFFIGFVAGLCAALMPKLSAILGMTNSSFEVLSTNYMIASVIFSVLIGAVIMFFEWSEENRAPKDTFMTALALPSLLSGALNTANIAIVANDINKKNEELTKQLTIKAEIGTLPPTTIRPVSLIKPSDSTPWSFKIISPAEAASDSTYQVAELDLDLGIKPNVQKTYIVLAEETTLEEAQAKADVLQIQRANIVVTADGHYFILSNLNPVDKSQAVLDILQLQERLGELISPKLLDTPSE